MANLHDFGPFSAAATGSIAPAPGEWSIGKNVPWSVSWTGEQSFDLRVQTTFPDAWRWSRYSGQVKARQGSHPSM